MLTDVWGKVTHSHTCKLRQTCFTLTTSRVASPALINGLYAAAATRPKTSRPLTCRNVEHNALGEAQAFAVFVFVLFVF